MAEQLTASELRAAGYRRTEKTWHGFARCGRRIVAHAYSHDKQHIYAMIGGLNLPVEVQSSRSWVHPDNENLLNLIYEIVPDETPFLGTA